jgi:hypothetical protein
MFRGPATLMQANPRLKWLFAVAMAATVLLVAAFAVLPGRTKFVAVAIVVVGLVVIYPRALSGALQPQRRRVDLEVNAGGVYADGAPLALRGDIEKAYIRAALGARTTQHRNYGGSVPVGYSVNLPAYPLTVELIVRRRGQINIDPGGRGPAGEILTALGFPVTTCAPNYRATTSNQRTMSIAIVVLFVAAYVGYYLFMSTRH